MNDRTSTEIRYLGRLGFAEGLVHQRSAAAALVDHRTSARPGSWAGPETVMLLEHDPVITLGKTADPRNLLWSPERLADAGVEVVQCDRGGDVTYHGPGQLVGYPVLDLTRRGKDIAAYVRALEDVLIETVGAFDLHGRRIPGRTGVWVDERKIAAIGIHIRRWVTQHGFALNVAPNLGHFDSIVPCGIRDAGVTSLADVLGAPPSMPDVIDAFGRCFARHFDVAPTPHALSLEENGSSEPERQFA